MEQIISFYSPEKIKQYAVYSARQKTKDGHIFERSFIVLKNGYGVIERFTRLHEFAGIYANKTLRPIQSNPEAKLYYICSMLNYIFVKHGNEFGIRHVFEITKPMLLKFFSDYATQPKDDGSYRAQDTVNRCIKFVTTFMSNLSKRFPDKTQVSDHDLFEKRTIVTKKGKQIVRRFPAFQITGIFEGNRIFRDIPTKVMEKLIQLSYRYTPEITFGLCLQAFAGLRAGEVCNVRQETSPLGPGISFTEIAGSVRSVRIDLTKTISLRSDGTSVGAIKKHRIQRVYPAFLSSFMKAYENHQKLLKKMSFEKEYAPMFVNKNGKAMSYESYRTRFKELINEYLRPYLLNQEDPELRIYGQLLYENELGLHSLRHWYTVQLVLHGEDIAGIQSWRGDSNPESAFWYLTNKGELMRELCDANERLIHVMIETGEELYGRTMD